MEGSGTTDIGVISANNVLRGTGEIREAVRKVQLGAGLHRRAAGVLDLPRVLLVRVAQDDHIANVGKLLDDRAAPVRRGRHRRSCKGKRTAGDACLTKQGVIDDVSAPGEGRVVGD